MYSWQYAGVRYGRLHRYSVHKNVIAHRVENIISEPGILSVEVSVWL